MSWVKEYRYRWLFLALMLLLLGYPLVHLSYSARIIYDSLMTLVFLASLGIIFTDNRLRFLAVVLALPTLFSGWTGHMLPGFPHEPLVRGYHVIAMVFLSLTITVILRDLSRQKTVTVDSIYAAFSGYMLAGLGFGHAYCLVEELMPGSFQGIDHSAAIDGTGHLRYLLSYFSFMTLTTVGYGDITPQSSIARGLATIEAIVGQFYIAVLIAELIGKRVSQAIVSQQSKQG